MNFNFISKVPIGIQLKQQIIGYIESGALRPGDKMPSVRELAIMASVNPNTCVKVYDELEHSGYIYSLPKKGFYVSNIDIYAHSIDEFKEQIHAFKSRGLSFNQMIELIKEVEDNDYN